jgi:hypothetical protein
MEPDIITISVLSMGNDAEEKSAPFGIMNRIFVDSP